MGGYALYLLCTDYHNGYHLHLHLATILRIQKNGWIKKGLKSEKLYGNDNLAQRLVRHPSLGCFFAIICGCVDCAVTLYGRLSKFLHMHLPPGIKPSFLMRRGSSEKLGGGGGQVRQLVDKGAGGCCQQERTNTVGLSGAERWT